MIHNYCEKNFVILMRYSTSRLKFWHSEMSNVKSVKKLGNVLLVEIYRFFYQDADFYIPPADYTKTPPLVPASVLPVHSSIRKHYRSFFGIPSGAFS